MDDNIAGHLIDSLSHIIVRLEVELEEEKEERKKFLKLINDGKIPGQIIRW